jgi:Protein of unknown function (DUF2958)
MKARRIEMTKSQEKEPTMELMPAELRQRLLANGAVRSETDHIPVVKFFDPCGAATWIITEMMSDGDSLFGIADLGFGCPELGYLSLAELKSVRGRFGLGIERDLHFVARFPLSVYAEAAKRHQRIVESTDILRAIAEELGKSAPAK